MQGYALVEQYKDRGYFIGKYRCVSLNDYDHCLSGEKGEIWEVGPGGRMKAFEAIKDGNEKIHLFDIKDLAKWVNRLRVPHWVNLKLDLEQQAYWANNPNARHEEGI